jgi:hypothetical protein
MPVITVDRVVDKKRIIGKKWKAEEEERHKGLLTPKNIEIFSVLVSYPEPAPYGQGQPGPDLRWKKVPPPTQQAPGYNWQQAPPSKIQGQPSAPPPQTEISGVSPEQVTTFLKSPFSDNLFPAILDQFSLKH